MAEPFTASGLADYPSDYQDSDMSGADVDFGAIEMFDSNSSQVFSSQVPAPVGPSRSAPEAVMSEDPTSPSSSKKHRRNKKHKTKRSSQSQGAEALLDAADGSSKKHRRKSKGKPKRDFETPGSQLHIGDAAQHSLAHQASQIDAADSGKGLGSLDVPNGHGHGVTSPPTKKKHRLSDSADGKRHKKRRHYEQEDVEDGNLQGNDVAVAATDFLRREKGVDMAVRTTSEEERIPESDPQRSPTVAHLRRRSQSGEARSRENSAPPATASRMSIDLGDDQGAAITDEEPMDVDPDVETLAREAWNEHKNVQKALAGAEDASEEQQPVEALSTMAPRRARSTRKKAKPTFFEQPPTEIPDDEANRVALGQLPSPTAITVDARNRSKPASKKQSKGSKDGKNKPRRRRNRLDGFILGRFTDEENMRVGKAVESFRADHGLTQEEVNMMIHAPGGTGAGDEHEQLWTRIFAECPGRHRQKIINTTRKRFHNFVARGTWTTEQDAELNELISVHGTKWSVIAAIINRHPEDLRDRYRNYLVCGPNQRKDAWDEAEEARLTQHIIETMEYIDEARLEEEKTKKSDVYLTRSYEDLIDWQSISEKMDRTRSRLQCITKWKSLNIRTNGKDKLVSSEPDAQISFRLEKARRQIGSMPDEERYRLVLAIQATAVGQDKKIPWQRLVDKPYRNKWHRTTQELLWHRLRQTVPGWAAKTTRDCCRYLSEQFNQNGGLPDVSAGEYDDAEEMQVMQRVPASTVGVSGMQVPKHWDKSTEFVTESDVEQYDDGAGHGHGTAAGEGDMQIDPALTQTPGTAKRATPAKRSGSGKAPSRKAKKASMAHVDPIQDDDEAGQQAAGEQHKDSGADAGLLRRERTPKKWKSKPPADDEVEDALDSDSVMGDVEDIPARIAA